jgi:hypothetical protein
VEFSLLEKQYMDNAKMIGQEKGDSLELQQLCRKAYEDYKNERISSESYERIYAICCDYAYPR